MATAWDAFISYARAASEPTAVALQRGLERFARPWHQRRAVRVFRDDSAMSTNPALWSSIEQGLTAAGHLIVLLSPAARDSAYVDKEVAWWLEHKGPGSILLVLDAGELGWDAAANRFSADSVVPPCLREAFAEEPRWLDLRWLRESPAPAADPRFAAAMADLSAPVRGVPRDELVGEDLTQHRRVRRLARSAVSLLVLLLVVSIVATVLAVQQRDDVLRQAVTLRARELAAASSGLLDSDLRLAQLLAVQGYRTEPSPATREALRQAAFASPLVERFASFDTEITAVAPAADAGHGVSTLAVGLAGGQVYTLPADGSAAPQLRFTAPAAVTSLRASADGDVLLVATAAAVSVWTGSGLRTLPGRGTLVSADAIALSPSGRRAVVVREDRTVRLVSYDTATGGELGSRRDPLVPGPDEPVLYAQFTERLAFLDEHTLRLVGNDARWLRLNLRTGRTGRVGAVRWTPYANLYVASGRADYLLAAPITNGQSVRVWPLDRTGWNPAPRRAGVQLSDPLDLAISPDGRLVLVNDSSSGLSVAPVSRDDQPPVVPATQVAGLNGVGAMAFLSPTRAAVAARTELAFLSFGGYGRGATSATLSPRGVGGVPEYAVDFRNSRLAVSPDGSRVAVLELSTAELQVVPLPGRPGTSLPTTDVGSSDELDPLFGPVWVGDDTVLVLSSAERDSVKRIPAGVLRWNLALPAAGTDGEPQAPIAAAAAGNGTVVVATSAGSVQTRSAPDGDLVGTIEAGAPGTEYELASFSPDLRHLALVDIGDHVDGTGPATATLRVVAAGSGEVVHEQRWSDGAGIAGLEFAGTTVLVSRLDGSVDLLPDLGRGAVRRLSTAGVRTSTGSTQRYPPVVGAGGLVGLPTRSGLQLYDLATQHPAGTLPVPPGFEAVPRGYAFAPDGHTLVTGFFGADARTAGVSVRDLDAEAVAAQACASAGGSISAAQWLRVVGDDLPPELACR